MRNFDRIGVQIPLTLLPRKGIDLTRWAVVACDQYTSQPEYWEKVEKFVGPNVSTMNMILPEVYLEKPDVEQRIIKAQTKMRDYLVRHIFEPCEKLIYVERKIHGRSLNGIMLALDLEKYDFRPNSQSIIRASEATITERIPPRLKIRNGAILEFPHILILIDDPEKTVIEPLSQNKFKFNPLYDFDLMFNSGRLTGYTVEPVEQMEAVVNALTKLADPIHFQKKYNLPSDKQVLLFAVGDGNHSMATAKVFWEQIKDKVDANHPARYVLVEVVNIYDEGLVFEPIHRVFFEFKGNIFDALNNYFPNSILKSVCESREEMISIVKGDHGTPMSHKIGVVTRDGYYIIDIKQPKANLPVATLQGFVDTMLRESMLSKVDYVHGDDVVCDLGQRGSNVGFFVPTMDKNQLFKTVILDGNLPKKAFSMGHADDKRFYMEGRKIA